MALDVGNCQAHPVVPAHDPRLGQMIEPLFPDTDSDKDNITEEEVINHQQDDFHYNMGENADLYDPRERWMLGQIGVNAVTPDNANSNDSPIVHFDTDSSRVSPEYTSVIHEYAQNSVNSGVDSDSL
jgi:outer membrane protein OmpA-like peptidoglycan-associated protein